MLINVLTSCQKLVNNSLHPVDKTPISTDKGSFTIISKEPVPIIVFVVNNLNIGC